MGQLLLAFLLRLPTSRRCLTLAVIVLAAAGCSKRVVVRDSFPAPVIEPLPFTAALYLDDDLRSHTHTEKLPEGSNWTIELGQANAAFFQQLFKGMFRSMVMVDAPRADGGVAAVIRPGIVDYQFSTPNQSKTDYYEAWIKYRLRVYTPAGKQVADWKFTAYGRRRAEFLDTEDSLNKATRMAMRDAAAAVVVQFMEQPSIRAQFYGTEPGGTAPPKTTRTDPEAAPDAG